MIRTTLLTSVLIMAGCAAVTHEPFEHERFNIPDPTMAPKPQLANRVTVPKNAPWLTKQLQAVYRDVLASVALQQISGAYPVRFTFAVSSDPLVSSPATAITIQDHLNAVCGQADWAYTITADGVILISDVETKTYFLSSQPGGTNANVRLRNLGTHSSVSGTTNNLQVNLNPYTDEIMTLLKTALNLPPDATEVASEALAAQKAPARRTSIAVLPSANAVVVTAPPHLLRRADRAIADYIAATARSVILHIAFFEVDLSSTLERSLNLNLLRAAANTFGIQLQPSTGPATADGSSLSFNVGEGRAAGSSLVTRWLNTAGKTSITFEDTVEVRNNAVGSLDVTRTRQYVRSITQASQSQGATTSLSPQVEFDSLRTGWSIHIQPTIVDDLIIVRFSLSRSDYLEAVPYSFDQGRISGTNFVTDDYHRVMAISMQNGETKLLASLNSQESRDVSSHVPIFSWLNNRKNKASRNRETVMMLSAKIL